MHHPSFIASISYKDIPCIVQDLHTYFCHQCNFFFLWRPLFKKAFEKIFYVLKEFWVVHFLRHLYQCIEKNSCHQYKSRILLSRFAIHLFCFGLMRTQWQQKSNFKMATVSFTSSCTSATSDSLHSCFHRAVRGQVLNADSPIVWNKTLRTLTNQLRMGFRSKLRSRKGLKPFLSLISWNSVIFFVMLFLVNGSACITTAMAVQTLEKMIATSITSNGYQIVWIRTQMDITHLVI